MYSVKIEGDFSSAHKLRGYKGKCEALHGHNWKVEVVAAKKSPGAGGLVMDFRLLKARLRSVLKNLDHAYLNDFPYFRKHNPTSENIARYIYDALKPKVSCIVSVTVWESPTCAATYSQ